MKETLIEILESFGRPVYLQGTLASPEEYPEYFFTFWNFETPEYEFYDNDSGAAAWGFWVYFYGTDPVTVQDTAETARKALKKAGFIPQGKPSDAPLDDVITTHTGRFFTVWGYEKYIE